jgi:uncharacterized protein (DUF697 family)
MAEDDEVQGNGRLWLFALIFAAATALVAVTLVVTTASHFLDARDADPTPTQAQDIVDNLVLVLAVLLGALAFAVAFIGGVLAALRGADGMLRRIFWSTAVLLGIDFVVVAAYYFLR